ncbi:MAG: glycerophosphoryl diester phosphodiesterase membrane domain-containing protein [Nanoarchaeota archaeon]|nr:glycerophosphoryl diester phosphodiesterase membrane domain-containing protein [Nanoarchaeota archaeon]
MAVKEFSIIFKESIRSFMEHPSLMLKTSLFLYIIPVLIIEFLQQYYYNIFPSGTKHFLIDIFVDIARGIASFLLIFTVIKIIEIKKNKKKEIGFREALGFSSKHFKSGFTLLIKMTVLLALLYLLFIIPGIIFQIYWAFSFYALINDKVDISKAMDHSKKVVKGRWWLVWSYLFLLGLIVSVVQILIIVLYAGMKGIGLLTLLAQVESHVPAAVIPITLVLSLVSMFYVPFTVIFCEKFYMSLKQNTKDMK